MSHFVSSNREGYPLLLSPETQDDTESSRRLRIETSEMITFRLCIVFIGERAYEGTRQIIIRLWQDTSGVSIVTTWAEPLWWRIGNPTYESWSIFWLYLQLVIGKQADDSVVKVSKKSEARKIWDSHLRDRKNWKVTPAVAGLDVLVRILTQYRTENWRRAYWTLHTWKCTWFQWGREKWILQYNWIQRALTNHRTYFDSRSDFEYY